MAYKDTPAFYEQARCNRRERGETTLADELLALGASEEEVEALDEIQAIEGFPGREDLTVAELAADRLTWLRGQRQEARTGLRE